MSNDIFLQILKLWGLKTYVKYFDRYQNYFSIRPQLIKGLYKDSLKIYELFWDVKMENGIFEKTKKQETQSGHALYTTTENNFL